jgi:hypothetical protein
LTSRINPDSERSSRSGFLYAEAGIRAPPLSLSPLAASFLRCAPDRFGELLAIYSLVIHNPVVNGIRGHVNLTENAPDPYFYTGRREPDVGFGDLSPPEVHPTSKKMIIRVNAAQFRRERGRQRIASSL